MTSDIIAAGILKAVFLLSLSATGLSILYLFAWVYIWPSINRWADISMWKDFAKQSYPNSPMPGWIAAEINCISERDKPVFSVDRWKQANLDVTGICPPNEQITAVIAAAKQKGWKVIA